MQVKVHLHMHPVRLTPAYAHSHLQPSKLEIDDPSVLRIESHASSISHCPLYVTNPPLLPPGLDK